MESFSVVPLVLTHDYFNIDGDSYTLSSAKNAKDRPRPRSVVSVDIRLRPMPIFVGVR